MNRGESYTLTAKGRALLAELRVRYEITPAGRAALAGDTPKNGDATEPPVHPQPDGAQ